MNNKNISISLLSRPLVLPCGAILKNRFVKSAMSDSLGDGEGNPTQALNRLYERWAQGGVALSLIGEVQGGPDFPEKPGNLILGPHSNVKELTDLTTRASINGAHIWPQIGHAGALSHAPISQPKGPSPLTIDSFKCDGMTINEVEQLPSFYVNAALRAQAVGFTGVQIHAGHGFLLSQFLSPLFNRRQDIYGGSIEERCKIIVEIIHAVRLAVGPLFPIGIKINSSDFLEGGLSQEDALGAIEVINQTSIDLIEISGGTYFPGAKATSKKSSSGALYADFAAKARLVTDIPLVCTGGIKTRALSLSTLESNAVDMIGLGRAMALNSSLPNDWLAAQGGDPDFPKFDSPPPGGITAWYTLLLTAIAHDQEKTFDLGLHEAIRVYDERDEVRCITWAKKYAS